MGSFFDEYATTLFLFTASSGAISEINDLLRPVSGRIICKPARVNLLPSLSVAIGAFKSIVDKSKSPPPPGGGPPPGRLPPPSGGKRMPQSPNDIK